MDSNAPLVILILLSLLLLLIRNLFGLSRKVLSSDLSIIQKVLLITFFICFPFAAYLLKDEVGVENTFISVMDVIFAVAALLIGLNWSINMYNKRLGRGKKTNRNVYVLFFSLLFGAMIVISTFTLGILIDL